MGRKITVMTVMISKLQKVKSGVTVLINGRNVIQRMNIVVNETGKVVRGSR